MANAVFYHRGSMRPFKLMLIFRRQVDHLTGGECSKTPTQLIFQHAKEFDDLRSLRNQDGTWMCLYFRETRQEGDFLTSLSVIGKALLMRSQKLGVKGISE
jgi:hypothetical protein